MEDGKKHPRWVKFMLIANFCLFSLIANTEGPAITAAIKYYHTTYQAASYLPVIRDGLNLIVSIGVFGLLVKLGYRISLICALVIIGISCLVFPFVNNFTALLILFALIGAIFALTKICIYTLITTVTDNRKEYASTVSLIEGFYMTAQCASYWVFGILFSCIGLYAEDAVSTYIAVPMPVFKKLTNTDTDHTEYYTYQDGKLVKSDAKIDKKKIKKCDMDKKRPQGFCPMMSPIMGQQYQRPMYGFQGFHPMMPPQMMGPMMGQQCQPPMYGFQGFHPMMPPQMMGPMMGQQCQPPMYGFQGFHSMMPPRMMGPMMGQQCHLPFGKKKEVVLLTEDQFKSIIQKKMEEIQKKYTENLNNTFEDGMDAKVNNQNAKVIPMQFIFDGSKDDIQSGQ